MARCKASSVLISARLCKTAGRTADAEERHAHKTRPFVYTFHILCLKSDVQWIQLFHGVPRPRLPQSLKLEVNQVIENFHSYSVEEKLSCFGVLGDQVFISGPGRDLPKRSTNRMLPLLPLLGASVTVNESAVAERPSLSKIPSYLSSIGDDSEGFLRGGDDRDRKKGVSKTRAHFKRSILYPLVTPPPQSRGVESERSKVWRSSTYPSGPLSKWLVYRNTTAFDSAPN